MPLFREVAFLLLLTLTSDVVCLELIMTPRYFQRVPLSQVNVTCKTKSQEPITSCQFRIWYSGVQQGGELIDITASKGSVSMRNPLAGDGSNFTATPFATSFKYGQCGVTLNNLAGGQLLAGCKLTTESKGAAVKTTPLYFKDKWELKLVDNSDEIRVKLGEDVSFGLKAEDDKIKLSRCIMKASGTNRVVTAEDRSTAKNTTTVARRYQAWLKNGQCGFTIPNFAESDEHTFFLLADDGTSVSAKVVTIVLEGDLNMVLDRKLEDYKVGDHLTATCTIRVIPHQDLVWTWKLGTEAFGEDKAIDDPKADWLWPWETTVSDTRSFNLSQGDRDKEISCTLGTLSGDKKHDLTASLKLGFKWPDVTTVTDSPASEAPTISSNQTGSITEPPNNPSSGATPEEGRGEPDGNKGTLPSWHLSSPEYIRISSNGTKTLLCRADPSVKLTDCGFSVDTKDGENFFNATLGSVTGVEAKLGPFSVKYHGLGLDKGECGIELTAPPRYDLSLLVGCRARTEHSGWKYNYTYIVEDALLSQKITLRTVPRLPYLLPGSNLTVRCDLNTGKGVHMCNFTLPGQKPLVIDEKYEPSPPHNYKYVGDGLAKGHCGIFIPKVDTLDMSNGNTITCETMVDYRTYPRREALFVVAEPPKGDPVITVSPDSYTAISSLTLKCVTPASRPPASIAWYLGDEPVSADKISEEPVGKWRWSREPETTTQSLTLDLTEHDEGKNVKCVMMQLALTANISSVYIISFEKDRTTNSTTPVTNATKTTQGDAGSSATEKPQLEPGSTAAIIAGVVVAVLLMVIIIVVIAVAYIKKLLFFKEHGPEEDSLNPSLVQGGRTAPQNVRKRAAPTQPVQPLRERRPTPPDTHELLPVRGDVADEKVEYAVIVRPPDAPPVAVVKPSVVPPEEEVEYTELSWNNR